MSTPATPSTRRRLGLSSLAQVPLSPVHAAILDAARKRCGSPAACRRRLEAEAHDLLALAQESGRLHVHWIDLSAGLRAKVELEAPVPCMPDPAGTLRIESRALLGLTYSEQAIFLPQPGYAFVRILQPAAVWLSNAGWDGQLNRDQPLCLGSLPAGVPLKEIILLTYGALTLQSAQIDLLDPAGVLNPMAADWWQRNASRIPLTREPFLKGM